MAGSWYSARGGRRWTCICLTVSRSFRAGCAGQQLSRGLSMSLEADLRFRFAPPTIVNYDSACQASRRKRKKAVTSTVSEAERPLRADARRNRDRILQSARAVFAESGAEAQIDDVARPARGHDPSRRRGDRPRDADLRRGQRDGPEARVRLAQASRSGDRRAQGALKRDAIRRVRDDRRTLPRAPGPPRPDHGNRVPLSRAHHLALSHSSRVMRQVQSMPLPGGGGGGAWLLADGPIAR